ncbi:MAG: hypothetical protein ACPGYT_03180 [Nitrospirales bacterium]
MKTVIVQGDGVASHALPEFHGQTLLQVARTPNLDVLANQGEFGDLTISTAGLSLSSVVTPVALLGYDPSKYCSGLGAFEAASLDVILEKQDIAFLCHLVTLDSGNGKNDHKKMGPHLLLADAEAGGIDSVDARDLIDAMNEQLGSETIQFYAGEQHRHLMIWIGGDTRCDCHNPRVAQGKSLEAFLPSGSGAEVITELMEASRRLLRHHPVNKNREQAGLSPANCVWLWGPGKAMELPKWRERWSLSSSLISSSGVHRGISKCIGIEAVNPQEHTEGCTEDFRQYTRLCLTALESNDLVYVHVPMPYVQRKIDIEIAVKAIEQFDQFVVGPLMQAFFEGGDCRLLVVCNHDDEDARGFPPSQTPYAYVEKNGTQSSMASRGFDEVQASQGYAREVTRVATQLLPVKDF